MAKVLLIESRPSGRQSAIAHKLENHGHDVYIAGSGGAIQTARFVHAGPPYSPQNPQAFFQALSMSVEKIKPDLIVPSSEDVLAGGIVDFFRQCGYSVFGPSVDAMWLEASKADAKRAMSNAVVPTAKYKIFRPQDYYDARQ